MRELWRRDSCGLASMGPNQRKVQLEQALMPEPRDLFVDGRPRLLSAERTFRVPPVPQRETYECGRVDSAQPLTVCVR